MQLTAHIKLPSDIWEGIASQAASEDLSSAQLIRRILRGWLDGQVYVTTTPEGPETAQHHGHKGYVPHDGR